MTSIVWERDLDAPPERVWPHLVVPEKMSVWSRAPIARIDDGDGGVPYGVGALRRVTLETLGRASSFEEVIAASEPPARLVYHVVRGLPIRDHEGVQTLEKRGHGTHLVWRVEFEPVVSPLGFAATRMLDAQMRSSLDALARVVRETGDAVAQQAVPFVDDDPAPLHESATRVQGAQRALAESLRGDPKYWFSRVYQFVTEEQIRFVRERARHPAWILRLLPVFHRFYFDNFEAWRAGRFVEARWRAAFQAMERAKGRDGVAVLRGLLLGVRAHIEEDLPRALAEVWLESYRGRCDFTRLRADYLRMSNVFLQASSRLMAEMPPAWIPPHLRLLVRFAPPEVRDWAFSRNSYDVTRARRKAFERGRDLAVWLAARG